MGKKLFGSGKNYLSLTGVDELLERLQKAGQDVDTVTAEALPEAAKVVTDEMRRLVPKDTGALLANIQEGELEHHGNTFRVEIGVNLGEKAADYGKLHSERGTRTRKDRKGKDKRFYGRERLYGVYLEYGTATMRARPFFRPAVDRKKGALRQLLRERLKKAGLL